MDYEVDLHYQKFVRAQLQWLFEERFPKEADVDALFYSDKPIIDAPLYDKTIVKMDGSVEYDNQWGHSVIDEMRDLEFIGTRPAYKTDTEQMIALAKVVQFYNSVCSNDDARMGVRGNSMLTSEGFKAMLYMGRMCNTIIQGFAGCNPLIYDNEETSDYIRKQFPQLWRITGVDPELFDREYQRELRKELLRYVTGEDITISSTLHTDPHVKHELSKATATVAEVMSMEDPEIQERIMSGGHLTIADNELDYRRNAPNLKSAEKMLKDNLDKVNEILNSDLVYEKKVKKIYRLLREEVDNAATGGHAPWKSRAKKQPGLGTASKQEEPKAVPDMFDELPESIKQALTGPRPTALTRVKGDQIFEPKESRERPPSTEVTKRAVKRIPGTLTPAPKKKNKKNPTNG